MASLTKRVDDMEERERNSRDLLVRVDENVQKIMKGDTKFCTACTDRILALEDARKSFDANFRWLWRSLITGMIAILTAMAARGAR